MEQIDFPIEIYRLVEGLMRRFSVSVRVWARGVTDLWTAADSSHRRCK